MEPTQAMRKTVVTKIDLSHKKPGDPLYPGAIHEEMDGKDVWMVYLRTRTGLLPENFSLRLFLTQAEAEDFVSRHPAGSELTDTFRWIGHENRRQSIVRAQIDSQVVPRCGNAGDGDSPLAFNVLEEAGLTNWRDGVSTQVLDNLGRQRLGTLKHKFGENWTVAAVYEYCCLNLPDSSPAYVAALYQFHNYITGDDFAAGYLWRDLETLVYGVETAALKSLEMRKKAGAAGSEKSALARDARRKALMDEIESLTTRNPDFAQLGIDTVSRLALNACSDKAPALWRQGRGQVAEYLGEIRRGEAGEDMRARYERIFGARPLRRLPDRP